VDHTSRAWLEAATEAQTKKVALLRHVGSVEGDSRERGPDAVFQGHLLPLPAGERKAVDE